MDWASLATLLVGLLAFGGTAWQRLQDGSAARRLLTLVQAYEALPNNHAAKPHINATLTRLADNIEWRSKPRSMMRRWFLATLLFAHLGFWTGYVVASITPDKELVGFPFALLVVSYVIGATALLTCVILVVVMWRLDKPFKEQIAKDEQNRRKMGVRWF